MLPGFRDLHPLQEEDGAQGALELMWRLQEILAEVCGLHAVSLQPAAGSQGELTGLMLMRAYFADRGEERDTIITADTAHGTNPASVTMAGYERPGVDRRAGNVDLDDLRSKVDGTTAGLMLTNPSTLGLFDEGIEEVERIFHGAGALRTTTAPISTPSAGSRGPATWASTSSTSTCTRRSASPMAAAGPAPGRSPCGISSRAVPPGAAGRA
jgi:glycine dehydrogenase subunit 2